MESYRYRGKVDGELYIQGRGRQRATDIHRWKVDGEPWIQKEGRWRVIYREERQLESYIQRPEVRWRAIKVQRGCRWRAIDIRVCIAGRHHGVFCFSAGEKYDRPSNPSGEDCCRSVPPPHISFPPPPPPHRIKIADTILPASQQQGGDIVRKAAAPILCVLLQPRYSV